AIDPAQEFAGGNGIVLIDHHDGHFPHDFSQIGLGIENAIKNDAYHHDRERGGVLEDGREGICEGCKPGFHAALSSRMRWRGLRTNSMTAASATVIKAAHPSAPRADSEISSGAPR